MTKLGVNIDHIATVRQARRETFPDPVKAALEAVLAGADGITAHLREDRRHIQDRDIIELKKTLPVPLNMEMSSSTEILQVALRVRPAWVCLVPEKRQELTTEGGLNLEKNQKPLKTVTRKLHAAGVKVSLFVDPTSKNMELSRKIGADAVELHTGNYSRLRFKSSAKKELEKIRKAAIQADKGGLLVNAGHGIDYDNVKDLSSIFPFNEFNIGFAIVARALSVGLGAAVKEMKEKLIRHPRMP